LSELNQNYAGDDGDEDEEMGGSDDDEDAELDEYVVPFS
jgi:hypothetical protein